MTRRLVLLVVAVLLTAAAAIAIAVLLFGDFGSTEGRILATTALLAGYGQGAVSLTTASVAGACSTSGSKRSVEVEAVRESTDAPNYAGSPMPTGFLGGNLAVAQIGR